MPTDQEVLDAITAIEALCARQVDEGRTVGIGFQYAPDLEWWGSMIRCPKQHPSRAVRTPETDPPVTLREAIVRIAKHAGLENNDFWRR